jgi:hypothetical protein
VGFDGTSGSAVTPFLLAVTLAIGAEPPHRIATLELEASGVSAELAHTLAVLIPNELRAAAPGAQVISSEEIRNLIGFERQRELLGCSTQGASSCLSEIGAALGAEDLVGGNIGRVGRTYVLVLRRLNSRTGAMIASATASVPVDEEDRLLTEFRGAIRKLFGVPTPPGEVVSEAKAPPWKYGLLVGGAALVVAGGIATGVTAADYSSESSKLKSQVITPTAWSADSSRLQTEGRVADALIGVGAVATGAALWLLFFHRSDVAVSVTYGTGAVGGALAVTF